MLWIGIILRVTVANQLGAMATACCSDVVGKEVVTLRGVLASSIERVPPGNTVVRRTSKTESCCDST
jgi:hypothetical protein